MLKDSHQLKIRNKVEKLRCKRCCRPWSHWTSYRGQTHDLTDIIYLNALQTDVLNKRSSWLRKCFFESILHHHPVRLRRGFSSLEVRGKRLPALLYFVLYVSIDVVNRSISCMLKHDVLSALRAGVLLVSWRQLCLKLYAKWAERQQMPPVSYTRFLFASFIAVASQNNHMLYEAVAVKGYFIRFLLLFPCRAVE